MLIDDLLQDVQDESTLEDSAITLLTNYHDQAVATAGDPAKLAQIKATIDANKAKIAAALLANTITPDPTAAGGDTNSTAPADGSAPPA